jgi:hypothetical protein
MRDRMSLPQEDGSPSAPDNCRWSPCETKGEEMKTLVAVSYRQIALLKDYSNKTGVPIDRCVSDALSDCLANVASANLEFSALPPLNAQLGEWGISLVRSRKDG